MNLKNNDLAFSNIILERFDTNNELIDLINTYYKEFDNVLQKSFDITGSEESLIKVKEGIDIDRFVDIYNKIIVIANSTFVDEHKIHINGVNLNRFFSEASKLFGDITNNTSNYVVNCIGFSRLIIGTIFVLHEFFARKNSDASFFFVKKGCELLGLTWVKYFNNIYSGLNKLKTFIITYTIEAVFERFRNKHKTPYNHEIISRCVSYASYPYDFKTENSDLIINAVNTKDPYLSAIYNQQNCKITFNDSIGVSAALFENVSNNEICLAFAGTRTINAKVLIQNILTDISQLLCGPDATYAAAVGLLWSIQNEFNNKDLYVVGHSLGGGLSQFSVACIGKDMTHGIGFNSAGLSMKSYKISKECRSIYKIKTSPLICHICACQDYVSLFGKFYGEKFFVNTGHIMSHNLQHLLHKLANDKLVNVIINY